MKKVCVVTATRAEYGLLRGVIQEIISDDYLELCLVVTGTHLSEKYGLTIKEIQQDEFPIAESIDILSEEDSCIGICKTMSIAMEKFGEMYERQMPDMLVVLGDRYELIPICSSAMVFGIPIAHISGGELTEGAIDDAVRHSITKMSYLHFPACEEYRRRIIQLGEHPSRVFNFGDVGVENIRKMELLSKEELEHDLGMELSQYASVTFHPVTLETNTAKKQVEELLKVIVSHPEIQFIVTLSNADLHGEMINRIFEEAERNCSNIKCFASLGIKRYLSLLRYAQFVLGNSSSGIIEAPCFGIPTINIGDRQKGRIKAESIIDCEPIAESIERSIEIALSKDFIEKARNAKCLLGDGDTSHSIVDKIREILYGHIDLKKKFYDI